uniref:Wsv025-like protein n=1 Tax=Metapenaeus ensis nimavirus TaxID=2133794 RepID=A0A401IPA2_9VIRU|nr:MAG: wsv025-like protein [Metapenaeus ensis nimavirus]GBG35443.1 wsv025-like protein [Metapenaeus ensis nimavirus]
MVPFFSCVSIIATAALKKCPNSVFTIHLLKCPRKESRRTKPVLSFLTPPFFLSPHISTTCTHGFPEYLRMVSLENGGDQTPAQRKRTAWSKTVINSREMQQRKRTEEENGKEQKAEPTHSTSLPRKKHEETVLANANKDRRLRPDREKAMEKSPGDEKQLGENNLSITPSLVSSFPESEESIITVDETQEECQTIQIIMDCYTPEDEKRSAGLARCVPNQPSSPNSTNEDQERNLLFGAKQKRQWLSLRRRNCPKESTISPLRRAITMRERRRMTNESRNLWNRMTPNMKMRIVVTLIVAGIKITAILLISLL